MKIAVIIKLLLNTHIQIPSYIYMNTPLLRI